MSSKNIKLLRGYRKPLSGGVNHFTILCSQFFEAHTDGEITRIYVALENGGIGIIGTTTNKNLIGNIYGDPGKKAKASLYGYYIAANSGTATVVANILGVEDEDLLAWYRAAISGEDHLFGFYRATTSGFSTVSGQYESIQPVDILSSIEAIEPVDIEVRYLGVVETTLSGEIIPIIPEDIYGTIIPTPYKELPGNIYGTHSNDINAVYSGWDSLRLKADILGSGYGYLGISGTVQGVRGHNIIDILTAKYGGKFSDTEDLSAFLGGHYPYSINSSIIGVGPASLFSQVNPVPYPDYLIAEIESKFPEDSLVCLIDPSGGFMDLQAYVIPATESTSTIATQISGEVSSDLVAMINMTTFDLLQAIINPSGAPNVLSIDASISAGHYESIIASYSGVLGNKLDATITPIIPENLFAAITPKVFFIESSIPINLDPYRNLKAIINAANCGEQGSIAELQVYIKGTTAGELSARIISVVGEYAVAEDEFQVYIKNNVISEDWLPLILQCPVVAEDFLPIYIVTHPFGDLEASIEGILPTAELKGSIAPLYYSAVERDSRSTVEWVNTKTGERRIVRIYFRGNSINYYYSELANNTYSFSPNDYLEIEVESYDKIETDGLTMMSIKNNVKTCIVDNLLDFRTIDDAIKHGIMCAVSEISDTLRAIIVSKGKMETLEAEISPNLGDRQADLKAKIFMSTDGQPTLSGSIEGTGGTNILRGYIRSDTAAVTDTNFVDVYGVHYVPKLVVHGNGDMSIVLTKVISADRMIIGSPSLFAAIDGVALMDIEASVTGTI